MTTFDPDELMRSQDWAKWSDCRYMVQEAHDIGYAAALEALAARIAELEAALTTIAELHPDKDSDEGYNEWGEADCFNQAQKHARAALENKGN